MFMYIQFTIFSFKMRLFYEDSLILSWDWTRWQCVQWPLGEAEELAFFLAGQRQ